MRRNGGFPTHSTNTGVWMVANCCLFFLFNCFRGINWHYYSGGWFWYRGHCSIHFDRWKQGKKVRAKWKSSHSTWFHHIWRFDEAILLLLKPQICLILHVLTNIHHKSSTKVLSLEREKPVFWTDKMQCAASLKARLCLWQLKWQFLMSNVVV